MPRTADPRQPTKVRQACDPCHVRKVRCDGCKPCANCLDLTIDCTYLAVHRKTGPKGPRYARRQVQQTSSLSDPISRSGGVSCTVPVTKRTTEEERLATGPASSLFQVSSRLSPEVIRWCLDAYFEHKYPLTPILHRGQVEARLWDSPISPEHYSLVAACCAVIALSPEILPPPPSELIIPPADFLISETIRAREQCNVSENQSLTHVQISFFLYAVYFCKDKDNAAWYYLRESITMLQTLRLHEETTYSTAEDPLLVTYGRRMFWVLFITERAYALQRNRPITLQETLSLPDIDSSGSDAEILLGFLDLVSLFRHFDGDFIATWNSATQSDAADLERLSTLQGLLKYTLPNVSNYTPIQQADLLVSRQWLKIIVWKLCVSRSILSITNSEDVMSLHYPATIARDVVLASRLVSTQAFEANGIGILEKVFDVGCSLADLLSLVPVSGRGSTMDVGPIDTLMEIVRIVGTRFGGSYKHLGMLASKANRCLLANVDRGLPLPAGASADDTGQVEELIS